jgi:Protein of unknown function (DUF3631)
MLIANRAYATMANHSTSTTGTQASDADKVVQLHATTEVSSEERARRLGVEVERLARLPTVEWMLYLEDTAKKYGVTSAQLKQMVEKTIKAAEKKRREDKAEDRQREQRTERQRTAAQREQERRLREQRRAQKEADKEAEKRQREREKELAAILKSPSAEHEPRLAALAKRLGEDLDFLRDEFSQLVAVEKIGGADIEPWPEPVELHALLTETMAQVRRYVVIHDDAAVVAIVLWIALTWAHEIVVHSPILRIVSGDADAGKTTLCGALRYLTPRAYAAAEPTGPSVYRFVDAMKPTLILDDADNLFARKPDLVHIINVSWTRDSARVPRQVHGSTYWFDVFCPKAIAGIGLALKPATLTRCIDIRMWPKLPGEKAEDFKHTDDDDFVTLRRKWMRWAVDNVAVFKDANPAMSDFNNRIKMNWKLQFAIADLAGSDWPKKVRMAAVKLTRERREPSEGNRALGKLWDAVAAFGSLVTSQQLEALFRADDEWSDTITKWQIADLLAPFGIRPHVIHPRGRRADRGYDARSELIERAFRHHLGKSPPPKRTRVRQARAYERTEKGGANDED